MRPFIIDDELKSKLTELAAYAEKHPFTMDEHLDIYNKQAPPAGDYKEFTIHLPFGYRVVYSIQQYPDQRVRTFSMSVATAGKLPSPFVVEECIKLLGFYGNLGDCVIHLEDIGPNHQAIQVRQAI